MGKSCTYGNALYHQPSDDCLAISAHSEGGTPVPPEPVQS